MISAVADTHAALWHLFGDAMLSGRQGISSTGEVVDAMLKVPRAAVPDMPDRIVAATAVHFGVPVVSRDKRIQSSTISSIW